MIVYCDLRRRPLFREAFRDSGAVQIDHYRNKPAFWCRGRRFVRHVPLKWLYSSPKAESADDKIIVFDSYTTPGYLYWLCREYPDKRIILWFWNMVKDPEWLKKIPPQVEVWSYARADCAAYGLKHNTQFFFDCYAEDARQHRHRERPFTYKAAFAGRDKGRTEVLYSLADMLEKAGVEVNLQIMPRPERKPAALFEKLISYQEIIEQAKDADILLDYSNNADAGLSLRPMEAMFYGKKLITNSREILRADFYDPANIYVLGEDKRQIEEFLAVPVNPADLAVRDRYLLSNWLKRFDTEGEPL